VFFRSALAISAALVLTFPGSASDPLIGLTHAVVTAERQFSGKAIQAAIDTKGHEIVYQVEIVRSETLHQVLINARNGHLISVTKPRLLGLYRRYMEAGRIKQTASLRPLGVVLEEIEAKPGRIVHEAALKIEDGKPFYEVEVATSKGVADVRYDAVTGRRLSVAIEED
jgi:uncharacterized membrane protein YkoI